MFRSPKLLKSSRGQRCTMNIVGICNYDDETTIAAHIKSGEGGIMGGKTDDYMSVDCCSSCHEYLDANKLSPHDELFYTLRALHRTTRRRIEGGFKIG